MPAACLLVDVSEELCQVVEVNQGVQRELDDAPVRLDSCGRIHESIDGEPRRQRCCRLSGSRLNETIRGRASRLAAASHRQHDEDYLDLRRESPDRHRHNTNIE